MGNLTKIIGAVFVIASICLFVAGSNNIKEGFDKKDNYYSSETSITLNKNAYVGGDAYNYIINGNYFTGYVVLGSSLLLMGTLMLISGILFIMKSCSNDDSEKRMKDELPPL